MPETNLLEIDSEACTETDLFEVSLAALFPDGSQTNLQSTQVKFAHSSCDR